MNKSEIAERAARDFHETYERLAPNFGYETRKESAVPWENVPNKNKRLMIAVCAEIVERAIAESQALARGLRFTFECGCASTFWAETGQLKGGLSCCKLHEANGQTLPNILEKCPMLLVRIGTVAG